MMRNLFLFLLALAIATGAAAQGFGGGGGSQIGNFCVEDFTTPANCTANDVRIEEFIPISTIEGCDEGTPGETEVIFRLLVSAAGSPDRYDIAAFIDLSGSVDGALTGDNCFHGYLPPPLTTTPVYGDENMDGIDDILNGPWANLEPGDATDMCGDIGSNTQILADLQAIRIPCIDNDMNGFVDLHACASWDNNSNTTCVDINDAWPGTASKCSCETLNTTTEIPVSLTGFTVE